VYFLWIFDVSSFLYFYQVWSSVECSITEEWHGVVVSGVRRMNEVNPRWAWLVLEANGYTISVCNQVGQLSLASLWGR